MYETLSGAPPLIGESVIETMQKHVNEKAPDFDVLVPELHIPWALASIVFKCLEKDPDDRYQSADEVCQALLSLPA
jgi:serine/threonine-protein kinase